MSDVTTPAGPTAPAAPTTPAVTPPPPVAAPVAAPVATPPAATAPAPVAPPPVADTNPAWLPERLTRAEEAARTALLKELGVSDPEKAKAAIKAAHDAEEAKKSAEQRAVELDAKLKGTQTEAERQAALIKEHAGRMLMALTPDQQKAISDFAGDNPTEQLRAIHHFAPIWAKQADELAKATQAVTPPATPPAAPPANTSPAPTAPPSNGVTSPPDTRATYQHLRSTNPFAAAAYGSLNPKAYEQT